MVLVSKRVNNQWNIDNGHNGYNHLAVSGMEYMWGICFLTFSLSNAILINKN
jgi:hypothetical protein